jgi:hypothetical protein
MVETSFRDGQYSASVHDYSKTAALETVELEDLSASKYKINTEFQFRTIDEFLARYCGACTHRIDYKVETSANIENVHKFEFWVGNELVGSHQSKINKLPIFELLTTYILGNFVTRNKE